MWVGGISYPQFFAAHTRSRLSCTAASGRPTMWKWVLIGLDAGAVGLELNNVGVNAIHCRGVSCRASGVWETEGQTRHTKA